MTMRSHNILYSAEEWTRVRNAAAFGGMPLASVSPGMPTTPESLDGRGEAGKAAHTPESNIERQDGRRQVIGANLSRRPESERRARSA